MRTCPKCDAATRVYGQDPAGPTDLIVRYRKCLNRECGHKFKTTQPPEDVIIEDHVQHVESHAGK